MFLFFLKSKWLEKGVNSLISSPLVKNYGDIANDQNSKELNDFEKGS